MSRVSVLLAPIEIRRDFVSSEKSIELVSKNYWRYSGAGSFDSLLEGESAAEEAFDLTNNPARQEERASVYGFHRSVSCGDIVLVDSVNYLCMSSGWKVL